MCLCWVGQSRGVLVAVVPFLAQRERCISSDVLTRGSVPSCDRGSVCVCVTAFLSKH